MVFAFSLQRQLKEYGYDYYNTTVKPLSVFAETPSFEYVYTSCHRQTDLAAGLLL